MSDSEEKTIVAFYHNNMYMY